MSNTQRWISTAGYEVEATPDGTLYNCCFIGWQHSWFQCTFDHLQKHYRRIG